jgi:hypothetical protein
VLVSPAEKNVANRQIPEAANDVDAVAQGAAFQTAGQRLVANQVSDGPTETQDKQTAGQGRHDIGEGRGGVRQVYAQAGDQSRITQRLAEGGETADPPQRPKGLMAQDVQRLMPVRAVEQRERDHANRRKQRAHHQRVRQHHRQITAQRGRQRVTEVNRENQRHQPRAEFAQRKAQHVHRARVLRQFFRQAETQPYLVPEPDQRRRRQAP